MVFKVTGKEKKKNPTPNAPVILMLEEIKVNMETVQTKY